MKKYIFLVILIFSGFKSQAQVCQELFYTKVALINAARPADDLHVVNGKKVEEQRNQDGSRSVAVTDAQGKVQTFNREADGGAQKAGRWFDQKLSAFGNWLTTPIKVDGADTSSYTPMM